MEEYGPETDKEEGRKEVPEPGLLNPREEMVCDRRCCKACRVRDGVPKSSLNNEEKGVFFFSWSLEEIRLKNILK